MELTGPRPIVNSSKVPASAIAASNVPNENQVPSISDLRGSMLSMPNHVLSDITNTTKQNYSMAASKKRYSSQNIDQNPPKKTRVQPVHKAEDEHIIDGQMENEISSDGFDSPPVAFDFFCAQARAVNHAVNDIDSNRNSGAHRVQFEENPANSDSSTTNNRTGARTS